jgi:hypothetical protein
MIKKDNQVMPAEVFFKEPTDEYNSFDEDFDESPIKMREKDMDTT